MCLRQSERAPEDYVAAKVQNLEGRASNYGDSVQVVEGEVRQSLWVFVHSHPLPEYQKSVYARLTSTVCRGLGDGAMGR